MGLATDRQHAPRSLTPYQVEGAWKLCILMVCIAAPCLLYVLYKTWRRKRRPQMEANQTTSPSGVQHINPAEFMQLCALRERRLKELEARRLVQPSQLDVVAPLKLYSDLNPEKSAAEPSVQKPPPTLLAGGLARWRGWMGASKETPKDTSTELGSRSRWDQCSICLAGFAEHDEIRHTLCDHVFHADCLKKWLTGYRGRCPLCQTDFGVLKEES